jgi:hypothetical protein
VPFSLDASASWTTLSKHLGTVLYREGDYVGGTVNLAARAVSAGTPGQFLITEDLCDAAGDLDGADFASLPPRRLKGIPDPISLIELRQRNSKRSNRETDPVCGLLLHLEDVATRITWRGITFAVCAASDASKPSPKIPAASLRRDNTSRPTNSAERFDHQCVRRCVTQL